MAEARNQAARILCEVERRRSTAKEVWEGPRSGAETALVYGVLRRRGTLDAVLAAYSSRRVPLLKPPTLAALRVALFEFLFLDDAPPHAVVNAAVETVRSFGRHADLGYVNAVLRGIQRGSRRVPAEEATDLRRTLPRTEISILFSKSVFPDRNHDEAAFLAARASTARWIARRRIAELGFERALACVEAQARTPDTHLRLAPGSEERVRAALAAAEIPFLEGPFAPLLTLPPQVRASAVFEACGADVVIQDAVAAQVAPFVGPRPGGAVLDYCAAPGGKTTHLAQLVGERGSVRAWDLDEERLALVAENAQRLALGNIECARPDGSLFDAVLVDVPCSNTGVLARRPEARWRVREKHLPGLSDRQLRILRDGAAFVGPEGALVYSTCSLEPEENSGVVGRFLERAEGSFALEEARTLYPDEAAGDGGFMARLRRL